MPGKRHSEEQIVYALRQVEGGKKVSEVCREMGVSQQAFYSWRRRYAGLGLQELRELRQLREENRKLKGIVADLTLDKHILQEVLSNAPSTTGVSAERKARLRADAHHALVESLPKPSRSADRTTYPAAGSGRRADSVRISKTDGDAAARRLAGKYKTRLATVSGRSIAGADEEAGQECRTSANHACRSHFCEPALVHGLCE